MCDDLVLNVDFAPTFLDYAGLAPAPRMQGRSTRPLLEERRPSDWRTSLYYRHWMHLDSIRRVEAHAGVRTRDRKLVYYDGDGCGQPGASDESRSPTWELFDLATDPYELRSVHDNPSCMPRLRAELARLIAEVGDVLEPPRSRRGVADRAIGAGSWRTPPSP